MLYLPSTAAIIRFWALVGALLALALYFGRRARSAQGRRAVPGAAHWLVGGVALAGDYVSAAMLLGTCGLIAFYGYDGFLYGLGFVAGWLAARLVVAGPLSRLGPTLGAALHTRFASPAVRSSAAASTLVVCLFFLSAEVVAAGALLAPFIETGSGGGGAWALATATGGASAIALALMTGAGSTWRGFFKGALLLIVCGGLALGTGGRELSAKKPSAFPRILSTAEFRAQLLATDALLPNTGPWEGRHLARVTHADGTLTIWRYAGMERLELEWPAAVFTECQVLTLTPDGRRLVNGQAETPHNGLKPAGFVARFPEGQANWKAAGPRSFLTAIQESNLDVPRAETVVDTDGTHRIYGPVLMNGQDFLAPGQAPTMGFASRALSTRVNLLSLMLALFCGAAALPALGAGCGAAGPGARKSTAVGMGAIGLVFLLTLFLGLGALTGGQLDPGDANRTAGMVAGSFGDTAFVLFSALGLALVVEMMRSLIAPASGALGELLPGLKPPPSDSAAARRPAITAAMIGVPALALGILFGQMNVAFLVGWAFNVAASANLPAITVLLFWKRATGKGIAASIIVGLVSSVVWILLSADAFQFIYGYTAAEATSQSPVPFNQPALVTIPLAYLTLIIVSLVTPPRTAQA